MTNREWLNSLSDEELAKWLDKTANCTVCVNHVAGESSCPMSDCVGGISRWLKQKRTESMPEIKIGDVIYFNIGESRAKFVVVSDTHANNLNGITIRLRAINNIWQIKRMNDEKELLEVIWRSDNANK